VLPISSLPGNFRLQLGFPLVDFLPPSGSLYALFRGTLSPFQSGHSANLLLTPLDKAGIADLIEFTSIK
jgi:hypothetical protein